MRIAIIGCGYVADFYMQSLRRYPVLELAAVMDQDPARLRQFAARHQLSCAHESLDAVLSDSKIELILNLTNPSSHFVVSKAALLAGKHVYSEKPLAMRLDQAQELVLLAAQRGLQLASAPCSILGESAQAMWKALRAKAVGEVRLVYAELDDGLVHRMPYRSWISDSGKKWPYKDEFEVGCTLEHAGYYLTWLTAFFGPAATVTAFSSSTYPDKETDLPLDHESPDFSVACIRFVSGVVARLTCSIVAPVDQRLRLFGDRGIMYVDDAWDYRTPVRIRKYLKIRRKMLLTPWSQNYRLPRFPASGRHRGHPMEFCRGPAELAAAVVERRPSALPADYCLHNNEIALVIQSALANGSTYQLSSSFVPLESPPWA